MSWHFLERWVEKANQHSTLVGKFWVTFLIVCRMVIVASVGDRVYNDEQSEFKCNTLQPGCTNVCFNKFSPISHLRFWSFQILFVATPSVMFVIYSAHISKMKKSAGKRNRVSHDDDDDGTSEKRVSGKANDPNFPHHTNDDAQRKDLERNTSRAGSTLEKAIAKAREAGYAEEYQGITRSEPFPRSTIIQLRSPAPYQDSNDKIDQSHRMPRRSNIRSVSSGRSYIVPNDNRGLPEAKGNENNNNSNGNPYVWREPSKPQQVARNNASEGTPRNDAQAQERALNDFLVWMPTNQPGNQQQQVNMSNSLAEADRNNEEQWMFQSRPLGSRELKSPLSMHILPTAPPEYPGTAGYENEAILKPCKQPSFYSFNQPHATGHLQRSRKASLRATKSKQKTNDVKGKHTGPMFTLHFRWYLASVFLRLCMESGFVILQMLLYGLHVPELYKCDRWPCPNTVDCFISRPMEKTIFLWFMFVYSCICVMLNFAELVYLSFLYIKKQISKKQRFDDTIIPKRKSRHKHSSSGNFHPSDFEVEQHNQGLEGSDYLASKTYVDLHGKKAVKGRNRTWREKAYKRDDAVIYNMNNKNALQRERTNSHDFIAFMLESEDDQGDFDFDANQAEQNDIVEFELDQPDVDVMEVDMGQDDPNDGDCDF